MSLWQTLLYQPLLNLMILFYNFLGHNMGVAIIALTVLIRLILLPPTMKSLLAQKKMKDLQPEMERIKKDHGKDKEKMAKATMELYRQYGVNPLSSCLPLLIQFPILIAMYQVFLRLDPSQFDLLYSFVPRPDGINTQFFWLDLAKPDHLYILPILAGAFQFWQSKLMTPKSQAKTGGKGMDFQKVFSQQMLYFFPLITVFIAMKFPAALALYWIVTTLFGVIQQYAILRGEKAGTLVRVRKKE